ncbi:MAG: hypothetical protein LBK99_19720 [Opitutaceae bacterium]|jgi:drug/metabolite transporter (DMT)-like permease|nr:hypothetical protein [Opitutaceae bacterium]
MPFTAILLVLASCVLHAGWNLACKSKTPSAAFFVLSTGSSITVMTPLYIWFAPRLGEVPPPVWGLLIATGFFQALYYISLGNAYRVNDISLAYPVVRALPVLLVPLACGLLGYGKSLSALSLTGMVIIAAGCMILPLTALKVNLIRQYLRLPFLFMVIAALATTAYSIIDSQALALLKTDGAQVFPPVQAALFYIAFENLAILGFLLLHLLFSRRETFNFRIIRKESLRYPLMSGPASTTAYVLVLLAMQIASDVSYVVAFRQISILIGVVSGILILKEKLTHLKLTSTLLIFAGLVLTALGQK